MAHSSCLARDGASAVEAGADSVRDAPRGLGCRAPDDSAADKMLTMQTGASSVPEDECDSLMVSESSSEEIDGEANEVAAMLCTLPPALPGLPSALLPPACELDGEWELCSRRPCGEDRFDRLALAESQLVDAVGARHFLVYTRRGPTFHGGALSRHGAALVWKSPAGVRIYWRTSFL